MRATETSTSERRSRHHRFRKGLAGLVGGLLLTVSTPVLAFPEVPGIIVDYLDSTSGPDKPASGCTPTCSLCHTSPSPSRENAGTEIANNLLQFRTKVKPPFTDPNNTYPADINAANFTTFLAALENDPCQNTEDIACTNPAMCMACDGDRDSAPDIAELRVDSDPNGPGLLACPKYGCGARIAPEGSNRPLDGTAALAALSAAIVFVRRFRRR